MDRRRFLSLVALSPMVAGCSVLAPSTSTPTTTEDTILGKPSPPPVGELRTDTRPPAEEPTGVTSETVPPMEYPTKPTVYDEGSVKAFVESHERAYRRNALLDRWGNALVSHDYSWDWTVSLATDGDAGVGRCQYRYSTREQRDGTDVLGDSPTYVVTYFVSDSTIVRAEDTGRVERRGALAPDLWETGVVLKPAD